MLNKIKANPGTSAVIACLGIVVGAFYFIANGLATSIDHKVDKDVFREAMKSVAREDAAIRNETAKEFARREKVASGLEQKLDCLTKELSLLNQNIARFDERWKLEERRGD